MHKPANYFWKEFPFLRILLPFIPGILAGFFYPVLTQYLLSLSLPSLMVIWIVNRLPAWKAWKWGFLRGIAIILLVFLAGACIGLHHYDDRVKYSGWTNSTSPQIFTLAVLEEPSMKRNGRYRTTASIFALLPGSKKIKMGMALVYFPKNDTKADLVYGTTLMLRSRVWAINTKGNPGQFDFATYYKRQGIYYQFFLQEGDYIQLAGKKGNRFNAFLFGIRNKIIRILQKNIKDPRSAGLAEALLIGYRNDLDQDLVSAYANTGVIHVIAISGLHLGLLYGVMMSFTSFLIGSQKKRLIQFLLVISLLWVFSLMTGGSASVIRSAFMFTLIGIGRLTRKRGIPLNTLAAAAFILLAFHPKWIMDTGFLLSFAAVASIMIYFDKIRNLVYFKNPVAVKFWDLISVTISAQILTAPLVLYYFNQFPLLFLFTNMVAVPLSGWILLGEIALCLCSSYSSVSGLLGTVLEKAIDLLNTYVLQMDRVSFSAIRDIYVSPFQALSLYICIAGMSILFLQRLRFGIWLMFCGSIIFSGIKVFHDVKTKKQKEILVLHALGRQSLMLIKGKSALLFTNEPELATASDWKKEIMPVTRFFRLGKVQIQYLPIKESLLIRWEGKRIYYLNGKANGRLEGNLDQADLIIVSNNMDIHYNILFNQNRCRDLIADGTNSLWKIQEWKKQAEQLHLRFHSVNESGAYRHTFY
jgi:competence protein ComEC